MHFISEKKISNCPVFVGLITTRFTVVETTSDSYFVSVLINILDSLIPLFVILASVVFLWGLLKYLIKTDSTSRAEAKSVIVYGVIIIFVMVSVWGLVGLVANTVGVNINSIYTPHPNTQPIDGLINLNLK